MEGKRYRCLEDTTTTIISSQYPCTRRPPRIYLIPHLTIGAQTHVFLIFKLSSLKPEHMVVSVELTEKN